MLESKSQAEGTVWGMAQEWEKKKCFEVAANGVGWMEQSEHWGISGSWTHVVETLKCQAEEFGFVLCIVKNYWNFLNKMTWFTITYKKI